MAEQTTGSGFRFSLIMRWGPAIIAILGFILIAMGDRWLGGVLVLAGIVFWLAVKRRKPEAGEPAASPSAQEDAPAEM